jgi:hypothetical integral membrane protein (TIGR02206 family)
MEKYFAYDYTGAPFILFSTPHLAALLALLLLNIGLLRFKNTPGNIRRKLRLSMAIVIWLAETSWQVWNLFSGHWSIQYMLPLNLCSALIWLSGLMLITRNYTLYEFIYFLGIGAAFQYLMTPDLGIYGFPHFRYFQTFLSHGLLLTSGVYMTTVEGFRPTWKSMLRVAFWINLYMAVIYPLNVLIGSNYLMINGKLATASLLDLLPPWPIYILYMEAIGVLTILILYLPFFIKDLHLKTFPQTTN